MRTFKLFRDENLLVVKKDIFVIKKSYLSKRKTKIFLTKLFVCIYFLQDVFLFREYVVMSGYEKMFVSSRKLHFPDEKK